MEGMREVFIDVPSRLETVALIKVLDRRQGDPSDPGSEGEPLQSCL